MDETRAATLESLTDVLTERILRPFSRVSDACAVAVVLPSAVFNDAESPPPNPGHPVCVGLTQSDYCREAWQLHIAELEHKPETHWHRCSLDRLCAIVPVIHQGHPLALLKLVCPQTVSEIEFERLVELLDLLVYAFERAETEFLGRVLTGQLSAAPVDASATFETKTSALPQLDHTHVGRAMTYIADHLTDPQLSVHRVAEVLGIHPNHLSRVFIDQTGERMCRYIARRRVERAQTLLATTNWQIKRIAHETGHANPSWFVYVFRAYAGQTPGQYRRQSRPSGPAT
ncbi:MAG: helix-turn-helix transcriptional regulator [Phycisphaerales bacterium]|nr:helix-turn-helix transcriptional regulator [Phycisphaerales bacterium]